MRIVRAAEQEFVPAGHEDPRNPGVLKRVIAQKDELIEGRVQMVNWARLPVGSSFRPHYHEDMEEIFIILSGSVEMTVDNRVESLGAGDTILIAPHETHAMRNLAPHDVDYVVVGIAGGKDGKTVIVQ